MRISTRGRYGLAALTLMALEPDISEAVTIISIANRLGISKIYLEQVFSLLKRAGIVTAIKGAQGGYRLNRAPTSITALDIFAALEQSLFEQTDDSVRESDESIELAMQSLVFTPLNEAVNSCLGTITLDAVAADVMRRKDGGTMFYI